MKTILLIDDNKDNLEDLAEILEITGYQVIAANNGATGLQKAKETAPDLILSDIQMTGMDGFELKEKLNDWHTTKGEQKIPFIFLTARCSPQDKQQATSLGVNAYLTKPVEMNIILETIETLFSIALPVIVCL